MTPIKAQYIGVQEYPDHDPIELWNLEEDVIPRHPIGSTVSRQTLHAYGYEPQEACSPRDR